MFPITRLSTTIRWLAGGSYLDISMAHHLPASTTFRYIKETIDDLNSILSIKFPHGNDIELSSISDGFTRDGRSPIHGCCGALDGLAIKIRKPAVGEVDNALAFYNRKGFFALNCQAVCDSSYRFTFVSCVAAGSTHDSTAFELSSLSRFLKSPASSSLNGKWIACDEAYAGGDHLVVPWSGRNLSQSKDCFNYWLSSARIFIEQCFGMLVARWGVLWRPLRVPVDRMGNIVILCCKLHNYIINEGIINIYQPTHLDERCHRFAFAPPVSTQRLIYYSFCPSLASILLDIDSLTNFKRNIHSFSYSSSFSSLASLIFLRRRSSRSIKSRISLSAIPLLLPGESLEFILSVTGAESAAATLSRPS